MWSPDLISSSVIFFLLNALHAYQIYQATKGMINDTYIIVLSVKRLDDALYMVNELPGSDIEG